MNKIYCYLKTPREIIKAEKILLEANIEVVIRPSTEKIFGVCSMAIEIDSKNKERVLELLSDFEVIIK